MSPPAVDALLELCVSDGRIDLADVDRWRRSLEASPAETMRELARLPGDEERGAQNLADASDPAYRAHASRMLFIQPGEVL